MTGCRAACLHRAGVLEYRAAREASWEAEEHATALYPAELAEYRATNPPLTFRVWLEGRRRPR